MAFLELPDSAAAVAVDGDLAAVSELLGSTLYTIDVADPSDPKVLAALSSSGSSETRIALSDNLLAVSDTSGVDIFDVADPKNPVAMSSLENPDYLGPVSADEDGSDTGVRSVPDIKILETYLYITDERTGLDIYDLSDPEQPAQAGQLELEKWRGRAGYHRRPGLRAGL